MPSTAYASEASDTLKKHQFSDRTEQTNPQHVRSCWSPPKIQFDPKKQVAASSTLLSRQIKVYIKQIPDPLAATWRMGRTDTNQINLDWTSAVFCIGLYKIYHPFFP